MKAILICCCIAFASGCSVFFPVKVTDERTGKEYVIPDRLSGVPGIRELAEACVTKAERVVHRTVEVDGYFSPEPYCDKSCWRTLAKSPFRFIEFDVTQMKPWNYLREKGLWRISKEKHGDSKCAAQPTNYIKTIFDREARAMDFCIAFERVEELKSEYEFTNSSWEKVLEEHDSATLFYSRSVVRSISRQKELSFNLSVNLFLPKSYQSNVRSVSCERIGVEVPGKGTGNSLLYETLK